jgi:hypothetical protein
MHFTAYILGIEGTIVEAGVALMTAEAFVVPFAAHGLNVLPDNWLFALLALRSSPLSTLCLAV